MRVQLFFKIGFLEKYKKQNYCAIEEQMKKSEGKNYRLYGGEASMYKARIRNIVQGNKNEDLRKIFCCEAI